MSNSQPTRKKRRYTILLVPDSNERVLSFSLHRGLLSVIIAVSSIFALGVAVLLFKAGDIAVKLQLVGYCKDENVRLREENVKLRSVAGKIDSIALLGAYLHRLASAVGIEAAPLPPPGVMNQDRIFTKDSLDSFLDGVRDEVEEPSSSDAEPGSRGDRIAQRPNIRPVEGWITKRFGSDPASRGAQHVGVDFAAPTGTPIRSTAPGVVDSVMHDTYFGQMVSIKHRYGFTTRYAHCSQVLVNPGDRVGRGQTIALVGNTGRSSAPHLHFEVLRDGIHVDPLKFILDAGVR